jgi:hypothetical protein
VPELEQTDGVVDGRMLTVRERLETHRANPNCSSCHNIIDPIGLALENFDVTGAWRRKDAGQAINPASELFDGTKLNGPVTLRAAILNYSDAYVRTFTENLMTYGLGRRVDYRDMPAIRAIVHDAARNDYRFSSFIMGIVKSPAFRMNTLARTDQ